MFSLLFILLLIYHIEKRVSLNLTVFIILSSIILVLGLIRGQFLINIFELLLISSNFIFIYYYNKFDSISINKFLSIILIFSFLQLFFDFFFPKDVIDLKDQFSGTFIMANNKSRFLFLILPLVLYLPKNKFYWKKYGKTIMIISVLTSSYLGYSSLGIMLFLLSVGLSYFIKNSKSLLFVFLMVFFTLPIVVKYYSDKDTKKEYSKIEMNYHRFFHEEHGVKSVYLYGIEKLKESYFLGVGYGNFSSRSGQLFKSEITKNIPKQLIKFWVPLFETKAPYGLSSLFVLIVELGIFAIIPIFILLSWFNKLLLKGNFYLRIMVIYTFFIINYNPTFFEFNEAFIYFFVLLIMSKIIVE
jgi:hypothetical protein